MCISTALDQICRCKSSSEGVAGVVQALWTHINVVTVLDRLSLFLTGPRERLAQASPAPYCSLAALTRWTFSIIDEKVRNVGWQVTFRSV